MARQASGRRCGAVTRAERRSGSLRAGVRGATRATPATSSPRPPAPAPGGARDHPETLIYQPDRRAESRPSRMARGIVGMAQVPRSCGRPGPWWVERATGIEPAPSVWKTEALPLSYARARPRRNGARRQRTQWRWWARDRATAPAASCRRAAPSRSAQQHRSCGIRAPGSRNFPDVARILRPTANGQGQRPAGGGPRKVGEMGALGKSVRVGDAPALPEARRRHRLHVATGCGAAW